MVGTNPGRAMTEASLRVPLAMRAPGRKFVGTLRP
jgi:hypothetical protein